MEGESKTEQYIEDIEARLERVSHTAALRLQLIDSQLDRIKDQRRQLAAVREWMAEHARDPETREAVLQLSAAMLWADEDGGGM